jgi:hypothetical protein
MKATFKAFTMVIMYITISMSVFACTKSAKADETAATAVESGKVTVESDKISPEDLTEEDLRRFLDVLVESDDKEAWYILNEEDRRLWASDPNKYTDVYRTMYRQYIGGNSERAPEEDEHPRADDPYDPLSEVLDSATIYLNSTYFTNINHKTFEKAFNSSNSDFSVWFSNAFLDLMERNMYENDKGENDFTLGAYINDYESGFHYAEEDDKSYYEVNSDNNTLVTVNILRYRDRIDFEFRGIVRYNPKLNVMGHRELATSEFSKIDMNSEAEIGNTYYEFVVSVTISANHYDSKNKYILSREVRSGVKNGGTSRFFNDLIAILDKEVPVAIARMDYGSDK